jgi:hypothetical protein
MRYCVGLFLMICLAAGLVLGGCQTQTTACERQALGLVERFVTLQMTRLINHTNEQRAKSDARGTVQLRDVPLECVFIPRDMPSDIPEPGDKAVRRKWVDHFALAQEFRASFQFVGVTPIECTSDPEHPCATFLTYTLTVSRRHALATDLQVVPDPPKGMKLWRKPPRPTLGTSYYGVGGLGPLEHVDQAPGKPADEATSALAREAIRKMAETQPETVTRKFRVRILCNADDGSWSSDSLHPGNVITYHLIPQPVDLNRDLDTMNEWFRLFGRSFYFANETHPFYLDLPPMRDGE